MRLNWKVPKRQNQKEQEKVRKEDQGKENLGAFLSSHGMGNSVGAEVRDNLYFFPCRLTRSFCHELVP